MSTAPRRTCGYGLQTTSPIPPPPSFGATSALKYTGRVSASSSCRNNKAFCCTTVKDSGPGHSFSKRARRSRTNDPPLEIFQSFKHFATRRGQDIFFFFEKCDEVNDFFLFPSSDFHLSGDHIEGKKKRTPPIINLEQQRWCHEEGLCPIAQ